MTRNRATVVLTAAAASAALAVTAAPAGAAVAKGLQDQEMTVNFPNLRSAFLTDVSAAKVQMLRFNTRWDGKNDEPENWQVNAIRETATEAAGRGVKQIVVSPNISGDASFNPRGRKKGPTAASKVSTKAYTGYIRSLATSLEGIPGITVIYAPLNEPNWYRHLPKRGGAAMYRKLHNIAYDEIKRIDPQAKVVFGELLPYARALSKNYPHGQSTNAGQFTREVLGLNKSWKATGSAKSHTVKADGVSLHTYDFKADPRKKRKNRDEWTQANLRYAKSSLKKAAKTKRISSSAVSKIYLTEFAYKTKGSDKIPASRAASYLKRAWTIAKQQKVQSFLWYQLRDPQSSGESWQSGLKSKSGSSSSTWTAFRGLK